MIRKFIREVFYSDPWKEYSKTIPDNVPDEKLHAQKQMHFILESLTDTNVEELYKDCTEKFWWGQLPKNYINSIKYRDWFTETELELIAHLLWLRNFDKAEWGYMNTVIWMINRDMESWWCIVKIYELYKKYKEERLIS